MATVVETIARGLLVVLWSVLAGYGVLYLWKRPGRGREELAARIRAQTAEAIAVGFERRAALARQAGRDGRDIDAVSAWESSARWARETGLQPAPAATGPQDLEAELARIAAETGERIEDVRDLHEATQACGDEERIERKAAARDLYAEGYAEAVARLREEERFRSWWSSSPESVRPTEPIRRHLADYLEIVGPDGPDVTAPWRRANAAELVDALASCVTQAAEFGEQDAGFVAFYLLPTGPIHRAIPLLQEHGLTVRPGFDGRQSPETPTVKEADRG